MIKIKDWMKENIQFYDIMTDPSEIDKAMDDLTEYLNE